MDQHVHRVVRSDGEEPVLLAVKADDTDALGFEIEGTEGDNPYFARFTSTRLDSALQKQSKISLADWHAILKYHLLDSRPSRSSITTTTTTTTNSSSNDATTASSPPIDPTMGPSTTLSASISSTALTLSFRRTIADIHIRLGDLEVPRSDSHELDTLAWVAAAAARSAALDAELEALHAAHAARTTEVERLKTALADLVAAKADGERELLAKFARLLNAKKAKVRDLLRVLRGSLVDAGEAEAVANSRGNAPPGARAANQYDSGVMATSRRSRKRKAMGAAKADDESESDEFQSMTGVQQRRKGRRGGSGKEERDEAEADAGEGGAGSMAESEKSDPDLNETTEEEEEEEEEEDDDDDDTKDNDAEASDGPELRSTRAPKQATEKGYGNKGKALESVDATVGSKAYAEKDGEDVEPPPRREPPPSMAKAVAGNKKARTRAKGLEPEPEKMEKMALDEEAETEDEDEDDEL